MPAHPVISFPCVCCEFVAISRKPKRGEFAQCPFCRYRTRRHDGKPFARREWEKCSDPGTLIEAYHASGCELTSRKARLAACAVARIGFDWCHNRWFREAIECGELEADGGLPRYTQREIINGLLGVGESYPSEDWGQLAVDCLQCNLRYPGRVVEHGYRVVLLGVYHELFANPFVPITWNPEWLTSTVRDLAAHVYESREFHLMPILGDALMDAGCEHQLVQDHCRSTKPHARGCWVVDAILGKN